MYFVFLQIRVLTFINRWIILSYINFNRYTVVSTAMKLSDKVGKLLCSYKRLYLEVQILMASGPLTGNFLSKAFFYYDDRLAKVLEF